MIRTRLFSKRTSIFILLLCVPAFRLLAVSVFAKPTSVIVEWDGTEGAVYYDLYLDDVFVKRLSASERHYEIVNLRSDTDYRLSFAARDMDNNDLEVDFKTFRTSSWDGVYIWRNNTGNDNDGKLKDLVFRVETAYDESLGQYLMIYTSYEGKEYRIVPLYPLGEIPAGWTSWKADGIAAETYRVYAGRFNTTSLTPKEWRIKFIRFGYNSVESGIESKVFGIAVETTSIMTFDMDRQGNCTMKLDFGGSGLAKSFMFTNPEKGSDGSYLLRRVSL